MAHLTANLIICEAVLTEKDSEVISAIRTMNLLNVIGQTRFVRFFTLALLTSDMLDRSQHTIQVQMFTREGNLVASAPPKTFLYGHNTPGLIGAYSLTTEFNLDLQPLGNLGQYMLAVYLDNQQSARAPLIMRRV